MKRSFSLAFVLYATACVLPGDSVGENPSREGVTALEDGWRWVGAVGEQPVDVEPLADGGVAVLLEGPDGARRIEWRSSEGALVRDAATGRRAHALTRAGEFLFVADHLFARADAPDDPALPAVLERFGPSGEHEVTAEVGSPFDAIAQPSDIVAVHGDEDHYVLLVDHAPPRSGRDPDFEVQRWALELAPPLVHEEIFFPLDGMTRVVDVAEDEDGALLVLRSLGPGQGEVVRLDTPSSRMSVPCDFLISARGLPAACIGAEPPSHTSLADRTTTALPLDGTVVAAERRHDAVVLLLREPGQLRHVVLGEDGSPTLEHVLPSAGATAALGVGDGGSWVLTEQDSRPVLHAIRW